MLLPASRRTRDLIRYHRADAEEPSSLVDFLALIRLPLICCFRIADGLNAITRRGKIGTKVPVFGFRPMRRDFLRTMKEPNEDSFTVSPLTKVSVISLSTSSTMAADSARDKLNFLYTAA